PAGPSGRGPPPPHRTRPRSRRPWARLPCHPGYDLVNVFTSGFGPVAPCGSEPPRGPTPRDVASGLAAGAPVGAAGLLALAGHAAGGAAAAARLAAAAVDGEASGVGAALGVAEVGLELAGRGGPHPAAVLGGDVGQGPAGVEPHRPAGLGLVDVADPGRDALVEQRLAERRAGPGEGGGPLEDLIAHGGG